MNTVYKYNSPSMKSLLLGLGLTAIIALGSCTVYSQDPYGNGGYDNSQNGNYDNGGYDNSYDDYNGDEPEITFNNFYSALAPYGRWVNYGSYGQVWVCADPGFRPYYSNGTWVNTNLGWSWNSGYSWGWAPFHYGRWGFASNIGWYWVPGYQWAPAWVYWGNASANYGWAPIAPGLSLNVNISIGAIPVNYWTYLPGRYMGMANMNRYYVPASRNNVYIRQTTIINNYNVINKSVRYAAGPRAADVTRYTGRPINTVRVVSSRDAKSGGGRINNGTMAVYRPGRDVGSRPAGNRNNNPSPNNGGANGGQLPGRNNPNFNNNNRVNNGNNGTNNNLNPNAGGVRGHNNSTPPAVNNPATGGQGNRPAVNNPATAPNNRSQFNRNNNGGTRPANPNAGTGNANNAPVATPNRGSNNSGTSQQAPTNYSSSSTYRSFGRRTPSFNAPRTTNNQPATQPAIRTNTGRPSAGQSNRVSRPQGKVSPERKRK